MIKLTRRTTKYLLSALTIASVVCASYFFYRISHPEAAKAISVTSASLSLSHTTPGINTTKKADYTLTFQIDTDYTFSATDQPVLALDIKCYNSLGNTANAAFSSVWLSSSPSGLFSNTVNANTNNYGHLEIGIQNTLPANTPLTITVQNVGNPYLDSFCRPKLTLRNSTLHSDVTKDLAGFDIGIVNFKVAIRFADGTIPTANLKAYYAKTGGIISLGPFNATDGTIGTSAMTAGRWILALEGKDGMDESTQHGYLPGAYRREDGYAVIDITSSGTGTINLTYLSNKPATSIPISEASIGTTVVPTGVNKNTVITGIVTKDGKAISGQKLYAISSTGSSQETTTDTNGRFTFAYYSGGQFEIKMVKNGGTVSDTLYCDNSKVPVFSNTITVSTDQTKELTISYSSDCGKTSNTSGSVTVQSGKQKQTTTDTKVVTKAGSTASSQLSAQQSQDCVTTVLGDKRATDIKKRKTQISNELVQKIYDQCLKATDGIMPSDIAPIQAATEALATIPRLNTEEIRFNTPEENFDSLDGNIYTRHTLSGTISSLKSSVALLYVFSDPIILVVATDDQGKWHATLPNYLEPGDHNAYIAFQKDGQYVASEPLHFIVKQTDTTTDTTMDAPTATPHTESTTQLATKVKIREYRIYKDPLFYGAVIFLVGLSAFFAIEHARLYRGQLLLNFHRPKPAENKQP